MLYNRIVEGKIRESLWPDVIHHEKKYQVVPSAKFAIVPKPAKVDEKDYDGLYTEDVESARSDDGDEDEDEENTTNKEDSKSVLSQSVDSSYAAPTIVAVSLHDYEAYDFAIHAEVKFVSLSAAKPPLSQEEEDEDLDWYGHNYAEEEAELSNTKNKIKRDINLELGWLEEVQVDDDTDKDEDEEEEEKPEDEKKKKEEWEKGVDSSVPHIALRIDRVGRQHSSSQLRVFSNVEEIADTLKKNVNTEWGKQEAPKQQDNFPTTSETTTTTTSVQNEPEKPKSSPAPWISEGDVTSTTPSNNGIDGSGLTDRLIMQGLAAMAQQNGTDNKPATTGDPEEPATPSKMDPNDKKKCIVM